MGKSWDIFLAGVGGQGILTIFKILGKSAINMGYQVNGAETHGMSQRGGSVYVHLRVAENDIWSPIIKEKSSDYLISLEPIETLRFIHYLKPEGHLISSINPLEPPNLPLSRKKYPVVADLVCEYNKYTQNIFLCDFELELRNLISKSVNIALLGVLTQFKDFFANEEVLLQEIRSSLPKYQNEVLIAFEIGKNMKNAKFIVH